jgi:hypothetical protein
MVFWLLAVIIVVVGLLIYVNGKKRKVVESADLKTHKECSFCKEEIEIDAAVCKYCRRMMV